MNTNKKKIRLTEADLHLMIKEAVKSVLVEMHWQTYANAGKKAHSEVLDMLKNGTNMEDPKLLKRLRQSNAFKNKAIDTSREKFSNMNDGDNEFYTTVDGHHVYYPNVENSNWGVNPMVIDKDGKTKMHGLSSPKMVSVTPERYFGYNNDDKVSDWERFSKEIDDFNNGKSQYNNGNWQ